jgi:hypothetical protein
MTELLGGHQLLVVASGILLSLIGALLYAHRL